MEELGWLNRRQRDGGIDRVPLPEDVPGALWLCGKHAIGPDHVGALAETSADTVVCLVERHELAGRYDGYLDWLEAEHDGAAHWYPIPDLHAPDVCAATEIVDVIVDRLHAGRAVLVHCAAGFGRTGTIAVCVLLRLGLSADAALAVLASARPGAGPEVGVQMDLVEMMSNI